jgi:hypothetical protein
MDIRISTCVSVWETMVWESIPEVSEGKIRLSMCTVVIWFDYRAHQCAFCELRTYIKVHGGNRK